MVDGHTEPVKQPPSSRVRKDLGRRSGDLHRPEPARPCLSEFEVHERLPNDPKSVRVVAAGCRSTSVSLFLHDPNLPTVPHKAAANRVAGIVPQESAALRGTVLV